MPSRSRSGYDSPRKRGGCGRLEESRNPASRRGSLFVKQRYDHPAQCGTSTGAAQLGERAASAARSRPDPGTAAVQTAFASPKLSASEGLAGGSASETD